MLLMRPARRAGGATESEAMAGSGRRDSMAAPTWAAAGAVPVPRLWTAFVLGWLPMLGFVAWGLVQEELGPPRLAAALLGLAGLGGLYLWLTLRGALTGADLTPAGPAPTMVRRRLLLLAAMTALVAALVLFVPHGEMW